MSHECKFLKITEVIAIEALPTNLRSRSYEGRQSGSESTNSPSSDSARYRKPILQPTSETLQSDCDLCLNQRSAQIPSRQVFCTSSTVPSW